MQSVNVPFVVNVHQSVAQNVVSEKTEEPPTPRVSEKRLLATQFYQTELMHNSALKDKEKFKISWGTYSEIKRELKGNGA